MLYMNKLLFTILIISNFLCLSQNETHNLNSHLTYLNEESNEINVDPSSFYYVTEDSQDDFMQNMRASLFSFVQNNSSTSNDEMKLLKNGDELDFNSSCSVSQVSYNLILKNLNNDKNYQGLNIKTIEKGKAFNVNSDNLTSIIFYSYKLRYLIEPYLEKAKELKSEHDLDYILISLDTDKLVSLKDSYQNLPIGY